MPEHQHLLATSHDTGSKTRGFATSVPLQNSTNNIMPTQRGLMRYMPKTWVGKTLLAGIVLADVAVFEWYFWGHGGTGKN